MKNFRVTSLIIAFIGVCILIWIIKLYTGFVLKPIIGKNTAIEGSVLNVQIFNPNSAFNIKRYSVKKRKEVVEITTYITFFRKFNHTIGQDVITVPVELSEDVSEVYVKGTKERELVWSRDSGIKIFD